MPFFHRLYTSLRLTFRWSTSSQTWKERLGDLVLLGGIVATVILALLFQTNWWQTIAVAAVCLTPAVPMSLTGSLKLFGPVLYYDVIRQARRSRFAILRMLYVLVLAFLLVMVAASLTQWNFFTAGVRDVGASIAGTYFDVFIVAQLITVIVLTPAYVGGAIAEEKERKTLEFVLATDLLNREIVLSKLGSRLGNLALLVLAGLPILSILQFLGGVDPNLVLAVFAVTALTIASQAGVSILCSVVCQKPRDAIALSWFIVIAYYGFALVLFLTFQWAPTLATLPVLPEVVDLYNKGNLIVGFVKVQAAGSSGTLATTLPTLVGDYAIFHGLVALGTTALAIARIRRAALAQSYGKPLKSRRRWRLFRRPQVGLRPMLWKELHCDDRTRSPWLTIIIGTLLLGITFVPVVFIVWDFVFMSGRYLMARYGNDPGRILADQMNVWVRTINVVAGCLTLLAIAVRASNKISGERDKQTLDTLLTTPLSSRSILFAKFVGSMWGARMGFLWLVATWLVALVTGGLHPIALPLLLAAWLAYASFAATLGLWFSTICRSSLRATVFSVLALLGVGGGHIALCLPCFLSVFYLSPGPNSGIEHFLMAYFAISVPPVVMGFLPFSFYQFEEHGWRYRNDELEFTLFCIAGIVVWAAAAFLNYRVTAARFRRLTLRSGDVPSEAPPRIIPVPLVPMSPGVPPMPAGEDAS
jgi:ABC-type transport system involved in multi-copper enzyme maturation permease subunit